MSPCKYLTTTGVQYVRRDFINLQTKELSRLLGCNCLARIYCESPSNSVNDSNEYQRLFGDKGVLMLACMESAWRLQAERIVKIDAKRIGFAIPLASNDFLPWFALGILESGCVHASEKLVVAAGQAVRIRMDLMRQQDAMESASRHMAQVMREQAWLRDLANYTRLEQSRLGIENVGQTIFEPLRRVINAEAVGLIDERGGSSDHRRLRSQCYGAGNWTPDDFMELLRQIDPLKLDASMPILILRYNFRTASSALQLLQPFLAATTTRSTSSRSTISKMTMRRSVPTLAPIKLDCCMRPRFT